EDGIRDFHVTGVQTCALPICATKNKHVSALYAYNAVMKRISFITWVAIVALPATAWAQDIPDFTVRPGYTVTAATGRLAEARFQIGSASCRERGQIADVCGLV